VVVVLLLAGVTGGIDALAEWIVYRVPINQGKKCEKVKGAKRDGEDSRGRPAQGEAD
jgi:hypothetical protein